MSDIQLPRAQGKVSKTEEGHSYAMRRSAVKQALPGLGTIAPGQLTSSDLVTLRRSHWSNEDLNGVVRVQLEKLTNEVIMTALASAVLANEEAGALRLKVSREEVFFGLFTSTTLQVVRTGNDPQWPVGSLEERVNKQFRGGATSVSDIIYRWLGADSDNPWESAGGRIMKRMVDNKFLDREIVRKKVLKFFTVTSNHYVLPDRTSALVTRQPVRRLLDECQQTRSVVHDQMMRGVQNGIDRRRTVPGDSYYY